MIPVAAFVLGGLGIAAAVAAYAASDKPECATIDTRTITPEEIQAAAPRVLKWAEKWMKRLDGDAQQAYIELAQAVYPQCKWSLASNTQFIQADGSSVGWRDVMAALRGKKVSEMAMALQPFGPMSGLETGGGGRVAQSGFPQSARVLVGG